MHESNTSNHPNKYRNIHKAFLSTILVLIIYIYIYILYIYILYIYIYIYIYIHMDVYALNLFIEHS